MDVPDQPQAKMYPQDPVLEVGGNVTVCCITPEGMAFGSLGYGKRMVAVTRLSRRSYSTTITNLHKSSYTGANVPCFFNDSSILTGTVLFIGCESHCPPVSLTVCRSDTSILTGTMLFDSCESH